MNIVGQVLSREQMAHLAELGVDTSDASVAWYMSPNTNRWKIKVKDKFAHEMLRRISPERYIPTYTIGDLIKKLPKSIDISYGEYDLEILIKGEYVEVKYANDGDYTPFSCSNLPLIESLYSILCWLAKTHKELLDVKK